MSNTTDLLGNELSDNEAELLRLYGEMKAFAARSDLPPSVDRNAKVALSALNVAVNSQALVWEHLYDQGV